MTHRRDRDDQARIRALYEAWFGAMEAGDLEALLGLLTPDAVLKMPGSPALVGQASIGSALRGFHAEMSEEVEFRVEEVEVSGDLAYARVTEKATVVPRAGAGAPGVPIEGMHLAVLRRLPTGEWRVARDVSSLDAWPGRGGG